MGKRKKTNDPKQSSQASNEDLQNSSPSQQSSGTSQSPTSIPTNVSQKATDVAQQPSAVTSTPPKDSSETNVTGSASETSIPCQKTDQKESPLPSPKTTGVTPQTVSPSSKSAALATSSAAQLTETVASPAPSVSPLPKPKELIAQAVLPVSAPKDVAPSFLPTEVKSPAASMSVTEGKQLETVQITPVSQQISKAETATVTPLPSKIPVTVNAVSQPSGQKETTKPAASTSKPIGTAITATTPISVPGTTTTVASSAPVVVAKTTVPTSKESKVISPNVMSSKSSGTAPLESPTSKQTTPSKTSTALPKQAEIPIALYAKPTETSEPLTPPISKQETTPTLPVLSKPILPIKPTTQSSKESELLVKSTKSTDSPPPPSSPTSKTESMLSTTFPSSKPTVPTKPSKQPSTQAEVETPIKSTEPIAIPSRPKSEVSAPSLSSPNIQDLLPVVAPPSKKEDSTGKPANSVQSAVPVTSPTPKPEMSTSNAPSSPKPAVPPKPTASSPKLAETTVTPTKTAEPFVTPMSSTSKLIASASTISPPTKPEVPPKPATLPSKQTETTVTTAKPADLAAPVAPPKSKPEALTPNAPLSPKSTKPASLPSKEAEKAVIQTTSTVDSTSTPKIETFDPNLSSVSKPVMPTKPTQSPLKQTETTNGHNVKSADSTAKPLLPTSKVETSVPTLPLSSKPTIQTSSAIQPAKQTETAVAQTKPTDPPTKPATPKAESTATTPTPSSKATGPTKPAKQQGTAVLPPVKTPESLTTPPTSKTESSTPTPTKSVLQTKSVTSPSKQAKTTTAKGTENVSATTQRTSKAETTKPTPQTTSKSTAVTKPTKPSTKPEESVPITTPQTKQTISIETTLSADSKEAVIESKSKPTLPIDGGTSSLKQVEGNETPMTPTKATKTDQSPTSAKLSSNVVEKSSVTPPAKATKPVGTAPIDSPGVAVKVDEKLPTVEPLTSKNTNTTDGAMKTPSTDALITSPSQPSPKKLKTAQKTTDPSDKVCGKPIDAQKTATSETGNLPEKSKKSNKTTKEKNPKQKTVDTSILKETESTANEKSEPGSGKNKSGSSKPSSMGTKKSQPQKVNTTDATSILDVVQEVIDTIGKRKGDENDSSLKDGSAKPSKSTDKKSNIPSQDKLKIVDENEQENEEPKKSKKSRKKKKSKSTEISNETTENELQGKQTDLNKTSKSGGKNEEKKAESKKRSQITKEKSKNVTTEGKNAENKVDISENVENKLEAGNNQESIQDGKDSSKKSKKKKAKNKAGVMTEVQMGDTEKTQNTGIESVPTEIADNDFQQKKKKRSRNKGKKTPQLEENISRAGIKEGESANIPSNNASEKKSVPVPKMPEESDVKEKDQMQPNKKVSNTLSDEQLSHLTRTAVHLSKSVGESERPGLTFTPDLIGCLLAPKPTDITALPDDEEEIEYRLVQRHIFLSYVCHVCKSLDSPSCTLKTCNSCKLISYCSKKHQREHWSAHKDLCKAICNICKSDGMEHLFQKAKGLSPDEYRYYRSHYVTKCANELGRELELWEKEIIYYPQVCQTCYEYDIKRLTTCQNCRHVSYCQPSHLKTDHHLWCNDFHIYRDIIVHQFHNGMIEPLIPDNVFDEYVALSGDMKTFISDTLIKDKSLSPNNLTYIALTDIATCPLTVLFSLQKSGVKRNKPNTLTVHLVGAEMHFEIDHVKKWELLLLHLLPGLQTLEIVFVGPELKLDVVMKTIGQNKVCNACRVADRNVNFNVWSGLYQDFLKSEKYHKPDLICAFNAGLYRLSDYNGKDTWAAGIETMLKDPDIPIVITEYTDQELPFDIQRIDSTVGALEVVLPPSRNPFTSSKPSLNFLSEEKVPVIFKNFNIAILRKGKK